MEIPISQYDFTEVKSTRAQNYTRMSVYILWMEEILHHRGWLKHVETL